MERGSGGEVVDDEIVLRRPLIMYFTGLRFRVVVRPQAADCNLCSGSAGVRDGDVFHTNLDSIRSETRDRH